jgi:hypothetical protein
MFQLGRDGLHPERVNQNQGAESTLAFLTALVEMRLLQREAGDDFFTVRADETLISIPE